MVFPPAIDPRVLLGQAFFVETRLLQHANRGQVVRHRAGFDAVEGYLVQPKIHRQADGFLCAVDFLMAWRCPSSV